MAFLLKRMGMVFLHKGGAEKGNGNVITSDRKRRKREDMKEGMGMASLHTGKRRRREWEWFSYSVHTG